jgi:hypothetical protein
MSPLDYRYDARRCSHAVSMAYLPLPLQGGMHRTLTLPLSTLRLLRRP